MNSKKLNINIEILRIISCLAVISIHVCGYNVTELHIGNDEFQICCISFFKVFVPIFVFITGYTFNENTDIKKLWIKNIYRIIIPIVVISIVLELFFPFFVGNMTLKENLENLNFSWNTIYNIFFSNSIDQTCAYHLWYLYELLKLYLLYPVLKLVVRNKKLLNYLIILLFVTEIIFPSISNLFGVYLTSIFSANIGYFLLYFLIGYYLKDNIEKIKINKIYFLLIYIIMIVLSICCFKFIEKGNNPNLIYLCSFSYSFIFVFIASVNFFIFFMKLNINNTDIIIKISKLTFSIYYLHTIFMYLILRTNILQKYFSNIPILFLTLTVLITFITALFCSFVLKYALKQLKKLRLGGIYESKRNRKGIKLCKRQQ